MSETLQRGRVLRQCQYCGEEFIVFASKVRSGGGTYCSRSCMAEAYRELKGSNNPNWKGGMVTLSCAQCGKEFQVVPAKAEKARYCSVECKNLGHSGENNPSWKGGLRHSKEGNKIYQQRKRARRRGNGGKLSNEEWETIKAQYGNKCLGCGTPESEVLLTIDHIIPISKGGRNDASNVQPLCQSCNSRKHAKTIDYRPRIARAA